MSCLQKVIRSAIKLKKIGLYQKKITLKSECVSLKGKNHNV